MTVSHRTLRRRLRNAVAAHDWLEGVAAVLGLGFFALAGLSAWGVVTAIASVGDTDAPPGEPVTAGFLEVTRGFAVVLFVLLALLAVGAGWFFAGDAIRRWVRRPRAGV